MYSSGDDPNKPCVFPFKYMDKTFNSCTTIEGDPEVCFSKSFIGHVCYVTFEKSLSHIQAWCSTAVDENGDHKLGFWGYCGPGCPTENDVDVVDVSECVDSLTHHYDDTDTPK